jgi:ethanolamine ammonia-lyase small subunit
MNQQFDFWKNWTQARIGLGRSGHSIPTSEVLELRWAHAVARDAVLSPWQIESAREVLAAQGEETITLSSQIQNREEYLRRPDLGRRLSQGSLDQLTRLKAQQYQLAFVVSDGLSSAAVDRHLIPFWSVLRSRLEQFRLKIAPLILIPYSRVAISDDVGGALGAELVVILVGERPGLSSADSLGAYLTYDPKPGKTDSERNCISNIRPPHGCSYEIAAEKLSYLIRESLVRKLSGIQLKEEWQLIESPVDDLLS